jgi:hypothetical protein
VNFDRNDLRTFLRIVRSGTIGAAAETLRFDVTTVRRRLSGGQTDKLVRIMKTETTMRRDHDVLVS